MKHFARIILVSSLAHEGIDVVGGLCVAGGGRFLDRIDRIKKGMNS